MLGIYNFILYNFFGYNKKIKNYSYENTT